MRAQTRSVGWGLLVVAGLVNCDHVQYLDNPYGWDGGGGGRDGASSSDADGDGDGDGGEAPPSGRWDPRRDNSSGVRVDPGLDGLVLASTSSDSAYIWVANTTEGSVSKVDTETFEEAGRYYTGDDPSRTSVNTIGDAYVGNRAGGSVTKIAGAADRCVDANDDGVITTSQGSDLLPFGEDECVLWRTDLPNCGLIRGVAAQDELGPDGSMHPYVWVGGYQGCLWKIDGETGEIVVDATESPVPPYGLALDGNGMLWVGTLHDVLGRVDTRQCVSDESCNAPICEEGEADCVKTQIMMPVSGYGITVDPMGRVWVGGGVARYDPSEPAGGRWVTVPMGTSFVHGIAADENGWIWGAAWETVYRMSADDPREWTPVEGTSGLSAKGVAIAADGRVWVINQQHHNATVITPGEGLREATVETNVAPFFVNPYTYSDMTGTQLRIATVPDGWYRELYQTCPGADPEWQDLLFDVLAPTGTRVTFFIRTSNAVSELSAAPWITAATVPDDESPASISEALAEAGVAHGGYLELEIRLAQDDEGEDPTRTPIVLDASVTQACDQDLI